MEIVREGAGGWIFGGVFFLNMEVIPQVLIPSQFASSCDLQLFEAISKFTLWPFHHVTRI